MHKRSRLAPWPNVQIVNNGGNLMVLKSAVKYQRIIEPWPVPRHSH
jgi:hypothetical protein